MGESVTEGSIVEWRKHVGDFVAEGDPLVEVTTDKVDVEVPATASGVVTAISAREGQTVAVGALLAEIDTSKRPPRRRARSPAMARPRATARLPLSRRDPCHRLLRRSSPTGRAWPTPPRAAPQNSSTLICAAFAAADPTV